VTTRLSAGGYPKVVDKVTTVTTPGETVDALVTEQGVAVNPRRGIIAVRLKQTLILFVPDMNCSEPAYGAD
jgi:citrate lyase subunit alpha / citrate CoA-transferase